MSDLSVHSSFAQVAQRIAARSRAEHGRAVVLAAAGRMTTFGSTLVSSRRTLYVLVENSTFLEGPPEKWAVACHIREVAALLGAQLRRVSFPFGLLD